MAIDQVRHQRLARRQVRGVGGAEHDRHHEDGREARVMGCDQDRERPGAQAEHRLGDQQDPPPRQPVGEDAARQREDHRWDAVRGGHRGDRGGAPVCW